MMNKLLNATRVSENGHHTEVPYTVKQSINTCVLHTRNTNHPARTRLTFSRFHIFSNNGANAKEATTISNNE